LFFGEARGYYCDRDFIAASAFVPEPFAVMVHESGSGEVLLDRLRRLGVTHIFINREDATRRGIDLQFSAKERVWVDSFASRHLHLVFERRLPSHDDPQWVQVYEVI
jgi:hypothetical protein